MAKRKKYPKIPNGYGSIKYLGKGRRNPYAVHPPTTEFTLDGVPKTPKALCYVSDWMIGFAVLTAYNAGTYYPGYEKTVAATAEISGSKLIQSILADYNLTKAADEKLEAAKKTFSDVYEEFYQWKYERDQSRKFSESSKNSTRAAYKNCSAIHDKTFANLRHQDLQNVVDSCPLKHASKELIVSLMHQMYSYAEIYELCDKDYSAHVKINTEDDDEHGVPFTDEEMKILWKNKENDIIQMLLIMCYSGFRITEYSKITINLDEKSFHGGIKTRASKIRTVPIYSGIYDMVVKRCEKYGIDNILGYSADKFRRDMTTTLSDLNIAIAPSGEKHTPHDCRHTFSALCEKYKVEENDRKRMLGHSFRGDVTNGVYGHRTLEELKVEIEKIKICY